ncbi:hypothetical protein [Pedobacter sp. SYSU D00535]|uniref:hypothetical protein n=1 Tax=Pedobacter sp. SYSU D00535 TaxID=2810308 RepID=UPI001A9631CD|nr:hypothetical protein [Pedobacter sp. SYSU D00535]
MKTITLITLATALGLAFQANAQSKKDSLKMRAELDRIRTGQTPPASADTPTLMRRDNNYPLKVDSNAVKPSLPSPTPPSSNNPNPYEPQPSVIHPNPPATPPEPVPPVPPGTPRGPGNVNRTDE